MLFGLFGKKKIEEVKRVPRIWKFPRDKAIDLINIRNIFAVDQYNDLKRLNYYSALADAGFDGFGRGKWVYVFGCKDKFGISGLPFGELGFPCPYLMELLDEES